MSTSSLAIPAVPPDEKEALEEHNICQARVFLRDCMAHATQALQATDRAYLSEADFEESARQMRMCMHDIHEAWIALRVGLAIHKSGPIKEPDIDTEPDTVILPAEAAHSQEGGEG